MEVNKNIYTVNVIDETFTHEHIGKGERIMKKWKPENINKVAAELYVTLDPSRSRHCMLLASRFNENSIEPNSPFPGWFLQIVGDRFSLAWGDGNKWNSVKTDPVENNKKYHVVFSLDNELKRAEIYLDGKLFFKENVTFKPPCDTLVIAQLSPIGNENFRFVGQINNLKLGMNIEVKHYESSEQSVNIQTCKENLFMLRSNITNIKSDIESLESVLNQIESWKLRGIEIDTILLENQILYMKNEIVHFNINFNIDYEELKSIDDKIRVESTIENGDAIEMYDLIIHNLLSDLEILNNVVKDLCGFRDLGVKLGDAFESIEHQKEIIKTTILNSENKLKEYVDKTSKVMDIVKSI